MIAVDTNLLVYAHRRDTQWHEKAAESVAKPHGPRIHDARIAAICLNHGVRELWTADRDYLQFPSIKVRNPLVA